MVIFTSKIWHICKWYTAYFDQHAFKHSSFLPVLHETHLLKSLWNITALPLVVNLSHNIDNLICCLPTVGQEQKENLVFKSFSSMRKKWIPLYLSASCFLSVHIVLTQKLKMLRKPSYYHHPRHTWDEDLHIKNTCVAPPLSYLGQKNVEIHQLNTTERGTFHV
jgi:hypothetical protein